MSKTPAKLSRKKNPGDDAAPLLTEIIVDRWTTLIVREIFFNIHRFEQLHDNLGIARNILSARLQHLVESDVLELKRYNEYPARFEYHLTPKGNSLYPFISTLKQWGDKWLCDEKGPPQIVLHKPCSHVFKPMAVCHQCGQEIKTANIKFEVGQRIKQVDLGNILDTRKRKPSKKALAIQDICSVERTLNLIGDRWTFSILRESFLGKRRFEQFNTELGISRNILSSRLKDLIRNGIFSKHKYLNNPSRYEYRLTSKGLDLFPTMLASLCWENRWRVVDDKPPFMLRHLGCGSLCDVDIVCAECGNEIQSHDVKYVDINKQTGSSNKRKMMARIPKEHVAAVKQ